MFSPSQHVAALVNLKPDDPTISVVAASFEQIAGANAGTVYLGIGSENGPYIIADREALERGGIEPIGYHRERSITEARNKKETTDAELKKLEENLNRAASEKGPTAELWSRAGTRPINILRAFPVNGYKIDTHHGRLTVPEHAATLSPARGLGLGQELLDRLNEAIDEGNTLADQLKRITLEVMLERWAYTRAAPIFNLKETPVITFQHYIAGSLRFFKAANSALELGLQSEEFHHIEKYLSEVFNRVILDKSDLRPRFDFNWFNVGYHIKETYSPTIDDVISATETGGLIDPAKVRQVLVNYDRDGRRVLVPSEHDNSFIATDPRTRFKNADLPRYIAARILMEEMFGFLLKGEKMDALDRANQVAAVLQGHKRIEDVPAAVLYENKIEAYNGPAIRYYRDFEEAARSLEVRAFGYIERRQAAEAAGRPAKTVNEFQRQADISKRHFWAYARQTLSEHERVANNLTAKVTIIGKGYDIIRSVLTALQEQKPIRDGKIIGLRESFY